MPQARRQDLGGIPFNACEFQSKGDVITDLMEDMAAEQKARTTYDNILRLVKDPDVCISLCKVAHGCRKLAVRTSVLADDNLRDLWIGLGNLYRLRTPEAPA